MDKEFNILKRKIRDFEKKYYENQMLKGLIIGLSIIFALFLVINTVEYLSWSSTVVRTVIFYLFFITVISVLIYYIIIPLFKIFRIGKTISDEKAALIIGGHFSEVSDRLLNVLQLKNQVKGKLDEKELELLIAGIEQKSLELTPVPFKKAVNLKENKRYLKYFIPPIIILLLILIISPAFITEPSSRIVHHSSVYVKPLPYQLILMNKKLEVLQHENITINVKLIGEEKPGKISVEDGKYEYRMTEKKAGIYEYTFKDVNNDIYFKLKTDDYLSKPYKINVFPKPIIYSFDVNLQYPAYLNRKNDVIENSGDIVVPEGTKITWKIYTKDTKTILFKKDNKKLVLEPVSGNSFEYSEKATSNFYYTLMPENEYVKKSDSLNFSIQVIKDRYPTIEVNKLQDDQTFGNLYFTGIITDDYGFKSLSFFYKKENAGDSAWAKEKIPFNPAVPNQSFSYALLAKDFGLRPGKTMSYFFEVRDNDKLNGYKRARSPIFYLNLPDITEIEKKLTEKSEQFKNEISKTIEELQQINNEIDKKRKNLIEKKNFNWSEKKQLEELLNKQKEIQKKLETMSQLNTEMNNLEELVNKQNKSDSLEKQEQLDKMFDKLANEKLDNKIEQIKKELEKINKDALNKFLEDLKNKNNDLKTNLDQNLELYKQFEVQQKLEQTISNLDSLGNKQNELADKTKNKSLQKEKSLERQKDVNKEFKKIEEQLSEVDKLNQELEQPFDLNSDTASTADINQQLSDATQNLQNGKQKKASQNQSSAGKKMKNLASNLSMMMQSAMQSRMGEDAEKIKKILDNLVDLSFKIERLMNTISNTSQNDPKYTDNIDQIKLISNDFKIIHDSLIAISKRQISVQPFVVKESEQVKTNLEKAMKYMQDRKTGTAMGYQQYSMTAMNNLALMLSESLDKMQMSMQMAGKQPGQQCGQPGKGQKSNLQQLNKMQGELNKSMMKGAKSEGSKGEKGINSNSEQLARMAAMQSEIRRRLQEYMDKTKNNQGNGNSLNELIKEMKKSEKDIINRKISLATLERQKRIEVRLLESEKAELERQKEQKRESKEGKNVKLSKKNTIFEFQSKYNKVEEIILTVPIQMSPYYNELLSKYMYNYKREHGN